MKAKRFLALITPAILAVVMGGCGKEPEMASPTCADLDKITDLAQRAELLKKCPRTGPEFKPSPKKEY